MITQRCRACTRPGPLMFCRSCRAAVRLAPQNLSIEEAKSASDKAYWIFSRSTRQNGNMNLDPVQILHRVRARNAWNRLTSSTL